MESKSRRVVQQGDAGPDDLTNIEFETSEDVNVIPTFDSMGLREDLLRGIYAYGNVLTTLLSFIVPFTQFFHLHTSYLMLNLFLGFEKPSAIQQRAIAPVIKGRDVIAQAQSGTGKTATFSISILQRIDIQTRETQVLVLSPTRELAVQIQKVRFSLYTPIEHIKTFYFF